MQPAPLSQPSNGLLTRPDKSDALALALVTSGLFGAAVAYFLPKSMPEFLGWSLYAVFAVAAVAWYRTDARELDQVRSIWLMAGILAWAPAALSYHFFRTRGWKMGWRATLRLLLFLGLCTAIGAICSMYFTLLTL